MMTVVCFVAIMRPGQQTEELFRHDLSNKGERIANMVHLIRLCGVIAWLGETIEPRATPEYMTFPRYVPSPPSDY